MGIIIPPTPVMSQFQTVLDANRKGKVSRLFEMFPIILKGCGHHTFVLLIPTMSGKTGCLPMEMNFSVLNHVIGFGGSDGIGTCSIDNFAIFSGHFFNLKCLTFTAV
jgi:hypothetical protein